MAAEDVNPYYDRLIYFSQGADLKFPFYVEKRERSDFDQDLFDSKLSKSRRLTLHRDPHYGTKCEYFFRVFAKVQQGNFYMTVMNYNLLSPSTDNGTLQPLSVDGES